ALLYKNFAPSIVGTPESTDLTGYLAGSDSGISDFAHLLCPDSTNALIASRMAAIVGVTGADQTAMAANGCSSIPGLQAGTFPRTGVPMLYDTVAFNGSQNQTFTGTGNLFN